MTQTHTCHRGGTLVNLVGWLPDEPFDHQFLLAPAIGCNRLVCERCGRRVVVTAGPGVARSYACACVRHVAAADRALDEPMDPVGDVLPWQCAGHPALSLPAEVDGVRLDAATDWTVVAREGLALGAPPHPSLRGIPGFAVLRLYRVLEWPSGAPLARAVGDLLVDDDARVRRAAARFFEDAHLAPGAERLGLVARDRLDLYAGVADPDGRGTLWDWLLRALAGRLGQNDVPALEAVRAAAVRPPGIGYVLFTLASADGDWVRAHADEIVAAAPDRAADVTAALRRAG